MASDGIVNGTDYLLYLGADKVVFGTAASFNVEVDTKNITARETHNWKKILPTTRKWSMEFEGKLAYKLLDGSTPVGATIDEIISDLYENQNFQFLYLKSIGVNPSWFGYGFLSSVSIEAPNEDNTTFNLSFTGTKELIQA